MTQQQSIPQGDCFSPFLKQVKCVINMKVERDLAGYGKFKTQGETLLWAV